MIWWLDGNHHLRRESVRHAFSRALSLVRAKTGTLFALTGTLLVISCAKVPPPETTEEQASPNAPLAAVTPAPTMKPHPAAGAKEAAIKMYPDLAVKGSTFNKTFLDLYAEQAQKDPDFLTRADWPLILANKTAQMLAGVPTPTPTPVVPQVAPAPNALERGAYNHARSTNPGATPWVRYY